jgi:hypothetical protein
MSTGPCPTPTPPRVVPGPQPICVACSFSRVLWHGGPDPPPARSSAGPVLRRCRRRVAPPARSSTAGGTAGLSLGWRMHGDLRRCGGDRIGGGAFRYGRARRYGRAGIDHSGTAQKVRAHRLPHASCAVRSSACVPSMAASACESEIFFIHLETAYV